MTSCPCASPLQVHDGPTCAPPACNDCGDPATVEHRTGTSRGRAFYVPLCEACDRECALEWEWKRGS